MIIQLALLHLHKITFGIMVETSVGQRFLQLIQQLGMSKNSFAMSLDKTATVIQHLVDERNKPGFDLMNKVIDVYPNVSIEWLLRGKGPMLRDSPTDAPVAAEALPVAAPIATAPLPPRVVPATPNFPAPLFTVSTATATPPSPEPPAPFVAAPQAAADVPPAATSQPVPALPLAEALPEPSLVVPPPASSATTATPPAAPDAAYLTAALHAQYLQHQLALAEQRNQHLLEQQQLMQQMLDLLRQSR